MLALRHFPILALLTSCNVYGESLLEGDLPDEGAGGSRGQTDRAGSSTGSTASAAAGNGSSSTTGGQGGKPPVTAGSSTGGTGADVGSAGDMTGGVPPGGGGGSAGTGGVEPELPTGVDMVDDMEDGNFYLSPKPPRFGFWYIASDKSAGSSVPKIEDLVAEFTPARAGSTSAVHFVASGSTGWGSSVGFSFTDAASKRKAYDAGDAVGLAFWVKGSVSNNVKLRVLFPSAATDTSGTQCGGATQGECLDHFATQVTVTPEWAQVKIAFASLHQAGWGALLDGFDPKTMLGIEWTADQSDLDIWLDDLALVRPE